MLESYWNLVKNTGRFWLDGNMRFQVQGSAPATPPASNYELYAKSTGLFIKNSSGTEIGPLTAGVSDHGGLTGLGDDDHTQYALLLGRSGGQTLIGGTAASNNLNLRSTSHSTKGGIIFGDASGGSIHPTLTENYHQFFKNNTSTGPDIQIASNQVTAGGSLGALSWGTRGASASDKRTALIHAALVGSGSTNPSGRLEFYTRISGGASFNVMYFSELGRLGVGVAAPAFGVHAVGASPNCHLAGNRLSADNLGPAFIGQKARGTPGSPSVVLADDQLLQLVGQGYENGSYHTQTNIKLWASQNWTGSVKGTYITFETTLNGGTTITERMRIGNDGRIGIGNAVAANSALEIKGAAANEADARLTRTGTPGLIGGPVINLHFDKVYTAADQSIFNIVGGARVSSNDRNAVAIGAFSNQAWTDGTAQGAYLTFNTTPNGSATRAERLRIEASGDISHASDVRHRMLSQNRFRHLNSMAVVYPSANQSISNATATVIPLDTADFDTDSMFVNASDKLVAKIAGKHLAICGIRWAPNTSGFRVTSLESDVSGSFAEVAANITTPDATSGDTGSQASRVLNLAAGQGVRMIGYQTSGGALNATTPASGAGTFLALVYLGE